MFVSVAIQGVMRLILDALPPFGAGSLRLCCLPTRQLTTQSNPQDDANSDKPTVHYVIPQVPRRFGCFSKGAQHTDG